MRITFRSTMLLVVCALAVGCESTDPPTLSVTGTVQADGQPLSAAIVTLEPIRTTTGPNASAPVIGGRFEIPADEGLHGGTYRVRVAMMPDSIVQTMPRDAGFDVPEPGTVIAPAFDADSTLSCDLIPDQPNELTLNVQFLNPKRRSIPPTNLGNHP